MTLTGKQRRFLRARGHGLPALVHVGKGGLSEAVVHAIDQALADHELIKVRIGTSAFVEGKSERRATAATLAAQTGSEVAQVLGNTMLLYRPDPDEPRIELP